MVTVTFGILVAVQSNLAPDCVGHCLAYFLASGIFAFTSFAFVLECMK